MAAMYEGLCTSVRCRAAATAAHTQPQKPRAARSAHGLTELISTSAKWQVHNDYLQPEMTKTKPAQTRHWPTPLAVRPCSVTSWADAQN